MAINLMDKWAKKLADAFAKDSVTAGKASTDYEFDGTQSIKILSISTQAPGNYSRSGTSRYGTPTDVQDTYQVLTMTQDKSFSLVVDKGDNSEQMMLKNAGKVMRRQQLEQIVPMIDKHNLRKWAEGAGKVVATTAAPDKTTIVALLLAAETHFEDSKVPVNERYVGMSNATYALIRTASEFVGCDNLTDKLLLKGYKGDFSTMKVVTVAATEMPTNVNFIAWQKSCVLAPHKIHEAKIHQDPPGISGHLLEGRDIFDAFVIGTRCNGVYASVAKDKKAATPTATKGDTTTALASSGNVIIYTLDGSDPRYSPTAVTYSSAIANPEAGTVIKAYAHKLANDIYGSDVLTHVCV